MDDIESLIKRVESITKTGQEVLDLLIARTLGLYSAVEYGFVNMNGSTEVATIYVPTGVDPSAWVRDMEIDLYNYETYYPRYTRDLAWAHTLFDILTEDADLYYSHYHHKTTRRAFIGTYDDLHEWVADGPSMPTAFTIVCLKAWKELKNPGS